MSGRTFSEKIKNLTGTKREQEVLISLDNIPSFLNVENFAEIVVRSGNNELKYYVAKEYFSIGTDSDYLVTPCTPVTLREFLKEHQCHLPTPTMVEQIYNQAVIKLAARPQRPLPGESIISSRLYVEIDKAIKVDREKKGAKVSDLVAGHKKDVVLTNALMKTENKNNVAIYGWYYSDGKRIQGLNARDHIVTYVDYSHGLRLISDKCFLNGIETTLEAVWADPVYSLLIHDQPLKFLKY